MDWTVLSSFACRVTINRIVVAVSRSCVGRRSFFSPVLKPWCTPCDDTSTILAAKELSFGLHLQQSLATQSTVDQDSWTACLEVIR